MGLDVGGAPGYIPVDTPYSNAGTELQLSPAIPTSPDCSIRPQTVLEVQRMRLSAARIAEAIQIEVGLMHQRKAYVEQMTAYINDRIRELNKVKTELTEEVRWIEVNSQRIKELSEREKLVKMEDILSCLKSDRNKLDGEKNMKQSAIADLEVKSKALQNSVASIKQTIAQVRNRQDLLPIGGKKGLSESEKKEVTNKLVKAIMSNKAERLKLKDKPGGEAKSLDLKKENKRMKGELAEINGLDVGDKVGMNDFLNKVFKENKL